MKCVLSGPYLEGDPWRWGGFKIPPSFVAKGGEESGRKETAASPPVFSQRNDYLRKKDYSLIIDYMSTFKKVKISK